MTPIVQNAALRQMGLNVVNVAFHVTSENLGSVVKGAQGLGLLGLMVTIPHKVAVMDYLDELDDSARMMGTVNLVHLNNGRAIGHNSDGYAAARSLGEAGVRIQASRVVLIGAGGAARCLAKKFAAEGAEEVLVFNRTRSRAQSIADEVQREGFKGIGAFELTETALAAALVEADILVNATSVGMVPRPGETPVPQALLKPGLVVYDIVYNPLETRLLREARLAGATPVDGIGMLVYTNERAVQICTGLPPPVELMRRVCTEELLRRTS